MRRKASAAKAHHPEDWERKKGVKGTQDEKRGGNCELHNQGA